MGTPRPGPARPSRARARLLVRQLVQQLHDGQRGLAVQAGRRLVQQQHARPRDQAHADRHALALAARDAAHARVRALLAHQRVLALCQALRAAARSAAGAPASRPRAARRSHLRAPRARLGTTQAGRLGRARTSWSIISSTILSLSARLTDSGRRSSALVSMVSRTCTAQPGASSECSHAAYSAPAGTGAGAGAAPSPWPAAARPA